MSSLIRGAAVLGAVAALSPAAQAAGDATNGAKVFKKCLACHTIEEGGASKIGPNLYGIVGRATASVEGFSYSAKMKELGANGHIWTEEELETFVADPKKLVPGTKMAFAGLKKPEERADLVAYLLTLQPADTAAPPPAAAPASGSGTAEPAPAAPKAN